MSGRRTTCLACGSDALTPVIDIDRVPVLINQLCHTKEEALAAPTAPIHLVYCRDCTHVFNADFDPELVVYGPDYENSLHHSGRFREYASDLVASLAKAHDLRGGTIVEIGCGNGDFLRELCEATGSRGFGFDPSVGEPGEIAGGVVLSDGSFFEAEDLPKVDLVVNRHVLEHVEDPTGFLAAVAAKLGPESGTALYLEVPNALYTIRDHGIWDLIYEHPSYFTAASLESTVHRAGFADARVQEAFEGQFLGLRATLSGAPAAAAPPAAVLAEIGALVDGFGDAYRQKIEGWRERLVAARSAGQSVALWGAGSKGSTFLNILGSDQGIEAIVDINPAKHGKFVSGTGTPIVGPDDLSERDPGVVVLMNPAYAGEVGGALRAVAPGADLVLA